jgi:hypothetical protein
MRLFLCSLIFCFLVALSCMKSYTTTSGTPIDSSGIRIIRIDSTRVGPEVFMKVYYREK